MMKLVHESSGVGELVASGEPLRKVSYRIRWYQGMTEDSGLPIPGLHRIEGSIDFEPNQDSTDSTDLTGTTLSLRLEDGRLLGITLVGGGRILSEGHGPMKCTCC